MSFAIIHRDLEREWENHFGVMSIYFLLLEILAHSPKSYTSAKILERMRSSNFNSIYILLWSILEQMSNGACGARLTSRIALLVCFIVWFCFSLFFIDNRVHDEDDTELALFFLQTIGCKIHMKYVLIAENLQQPIFWYQI